MRVFVAMSGGVDSSVAAGLLREQGHEVVGVWMRLAPAASDSIGPRCCGTFEAEEDARRAAGVLGIPFYALNYEDVFGRDVVGRFVSAYAAGETPNPCVSCNQYVKFAALLRDVMAKFGAEALATGHYARIARDGESASLLRARDAAKDQSYALYMLGQRELRRLLFPIGELEDKEETRRIAARMGLPTASKPDSQDICFIGDDYRSFVEERVPAAFASGPLERSDGTRIGSHRGLGAYTVGQRGGLGVATGERLYVIRLEPARNAVVVGRADEVGGMRYRLRDVSFTHDAPPDREFSTRVALRYRGNLVDARVLVDADGADLLLDSRATVAPGQAAVMYLGDEVLGGGVIARAA